MPITIRRATIDDLPVAARLFDGYRQFYEAPPDLALAERFLRERLNQGDAAIFLAFDGETGVGFMQLYPSFSSLSARRIWILNDLYVLPEARKKGVGRRLLDAARDHARATGAKRLVLSTAHTNVAAQKLYEDYGYQRDETFRTYEYEV